MKSSIHLSLSKHFAFLAFSLFLYQAKAQYNGPNLVVVGDVTTYTCLACGDGSNATMVAAPETSTKASNSGSVTSVARLRHPWWSLDTQYGTIQSGTYDTNTGTSTVTVLWTKAGSNGYVQYQTTYGSWPQMAITISACPLGTPSYSLSKGIVYHNENVTINANPGAGGTKVRWYTTSSGGAHFYEGPSYTTPVLTTNTTYYISSYSTSANGDCFSPRISVPVTVTPCRPLGEPQFTVSSVCSGNAATILATPGTNATGVRWYTDPSIATPFHEGNSYSTPALTSNTVFYISSYSTLDAGGCNNTRIPVTVTVNPLPLAPSITHSYFVSGNAVLRADFTKDAANSYTVNANTIRWYDQEAGGAILKEGFEYITPVITAPKIFYASAYNSALGCEGARTAHWAKSVNLRKTKIIKSETIRIAGIKDTTAIKNLTDIQRNTTVAYVDGLMRAFQQNNINVTPSGKDIIGFVDYDNHGRPTASYLPYVADQSGPALDKAYKINQANFYNTPTDKVADDNAPFARSIYESSPLGRVTEQGNVGAAWQPGSNHTQRVNYSYNDVNEVRSFSTTGASSGFYPANALNKITVTNEDGHNTIIYRDSRGRTLLKKQQLDENIQGTMVNYLETYYIYDDLDRVRYILSPKAVNSVKASGWVISPAILDQFAYQFIYDDKGRLIEKKVPGQAWSYFGYDCLNRLVLVQDGFLKDLNKWLFVKYDRKGRSVMSGLYTNTTQVTRADIQQSVLNPLYANAADKHYEERSAAAHGYTNQSFPSANTEILRVNYYDSYDFDYNNSPDFSYTPQGLTDEGTATTVISGFATGGKELILGTTTWVYNYIFYDKDGRIIQLRSNNHLSSAVDNLVTAVYDFEGKLLTSKNYHNAGAGKQTTVINKYGYDTKGRLIKVFQNNNSAATDQLVVQYEYNELGQLIDKKLHNLGGTSFLQSIDYRYTIRGWIASINNAQLTANAANNDENNDLFGMEFLYNTVDAQLGNIDYFNGNISAMKWKGTGTASGTNDQRSYKYGYDKAGRLKAATSQMYTGTAWNKELNAGNEALTYDHNGNILTLTRNQRQHQINGLTPSYAASVIDDLTYTYDTSLGDRLAKVEDGTDDPEGFKNGADIASEYAYDVNGSITKDENKGISNITYNFLGKVAHIDFTDGRKVEYIYDASGNKRTMKTYQGTTLQLTTDYVNGFVYENKTLSFFSSPEGRVVKNGNSQEYQYSVADHQGNTRVVFTSATTAPAAPQATFEGDTNDGSLEYGNIDPSNVVSFIGANHTTGGNKVVRMNQSYKIGPARSVKVYPGDKVDIEVWEYHEGESGFGTNSTPLSTLITMVAGAFGGVSGAPGESGMIYNGVKTGVAAFVPPGNQGSEQPAAYLNYILFDKNYNVLNMGWQLAPATTFTKQRLFFPTMDIREEGFVYVYLSYDNDSDNWVYFDDLKVTHTKTNVIQYNEYYPFGLQSSTSWTRENNSNNFLYNAGSEMNTSSGWYEMFYRGYDPALGRMLQVDPYAAAYSDHTPYNYALNNPSILNDPSGGYVPLANNFGRQKIDEAFANGTALDFVSAQNGPDWGGGASASYYDLINRNAAERDLINDAKAGDVAALQEYGYTYGEEVSVSTLSEMAIAYNNGDDMVYNGDPGYWVNDNYIGENGEAIVHATFVSATQQGDPNMARLLGVVNQNAFFGEKNEINWIIDYDGKGETTRDAPGATEGWLTKGKRNVYIHPSAFESSGKLFIILGHEYVHTLDHDNGVFDRAYQQYNATIANYYLEYRAYKWGALAESSLGISIGQQFYRDFFQIKLQAALDGFKR